MIKSLTTSFQQTIAQSVRGLRVVVTGANQGLGLEISQAFAKAGASVMMCARDAAKLEQAVLVVNEQADPQSRVLHCITDVADKTQVEQMTQRVISQWGGLDVLIANAGIYGPMGPSELVDWDEWASCIQINLLGTVLTCRAAIPAMKAQGHGKIVVVSGGGATKPMPGISAYAASKAGVLRFAETLAEELKSDGIQVNSIAPGALNTRLLEQVLSAGPDKVGQQFFDASLRQRDSGGDSPERAAQLCLYLASPHAGSVTGKLISAKWDDWEQLHEHESTLNKSDIYTLRRIVPADRGQEWGG